MSENCPYCGVPVEVGKFRQHLKTCPATLVKHSPQVVVGPPEREWLKEGEVPSDIKELIRRLPRFVPEEELE